jgi:bacterioferritin
VIELFDRILESELARAIHYTHYLFMVFGYTRIPIVARLREQQT